jgi:hypothetical protein
MNYDTSESKMANYILDIWDSILYARRDYSLHDHAQNENFRDVTSFLLEDQHFNLSRWLNSHPMLVNIRKVNVYSKVEISETACMTPTFLLQSIKLFQH